MSMSGQNIASVYGDNRKDKIPLPPKDAKLFHTACDYCIVGCAYNAFVWPLGVEGGPKAADNAIGVDFPVEEVAGGNWPNPNQHNIILHNGEPHNVIMIPAVSKRVNRRGNHSIRGGRIAQKCYNPYGPTADRLQNPLLRVRGMLLPISWDAATSIMAEVARHVVDKHGELAFGMKYYNYHYYENTYACTKMAFQALETPNTSHHDKPSNAADSTGIEDAGMDTFAAAYEDYRDADVVFMSGAPLYADHTIIFTEWIMEGKGKAICVLPRRTKDNTWAEKTGGVSFLVFPGSDTALNNAIARVIVENGWEDKEFIKKWVNSTEEVNQNLGRGIRNSPAEWRTTRWGKGFEEWKQWLLHDEFTTLEFAEKTCGIKREDIIKAAKILTNEGKDPRPKCTFTHEKGNYWSNNYLNTISLCNLGLICGSGNRPGRMIVRAGGHQRGFIGGGSYPFFKTPERFGRLGRKQLHQDRWVLSGNTRFMWVIGNQWIENMMGSQELAAYIKAHTIDPPQQIESTDEFHAIQVLKERVDAGHMMVVHQEAYLRTLGAQYADLVLPVAQWGEADFARTQGERVLRIYEKFSDPPGQSMPDWWIIAQVAKRMGLDGWNWKTSEDVFKEAARFTRNGSQDYAPLTMYAALNKKSPYDLLRERGATGYQTPLLLVDGKIIETKRLHDSTRIKEFIRVPTITTGHKDFTQFRSPTGKGYLHIADWRLFDDFYTRIKPRKEKGELWVTNGRVNEIWQSLYDDLRVPVITQRYPMNFVELHPDDARPREIETGDLVSIENDDVLVQVAGFWGVDDEDLKYTELEKKGYIRRTKGAVTAMAIVYAPEANLVKPGVAFMYFMWPGAPSQAVASNIVDPVSNAPRYKLGKGRPFPWRRRIWCRHAPDGAPEDGEPVPVAP